MIWAPRFTKLPLGRQDGSEVTIATCCERDAVSRLSLLGRSLFLDQPEGLPRTCSNHHYAP